ncbi:MAG: DoxX family protein [Betaproteobacteria bacterium]|nr:DoxX family protein [Betaproteobacteria bacterium]
MADAAILILRVVLGVVIVLHGAYKFRNKSLFDRKWQEDYGFPKGSVLLTGVVQVACGLAIIGGVFGRVAALILLLVMAVATYVCIAKHREPFLSTPEGKGWDINFLVMGSLVALILLGDGKWSLAGW